MEPLPYKNGRATTPPCQHSSRSHGHHNQGPVKGRISSSSPLETNGRTRPSRVIQNGASSRLPPCGLSRQGLGIRLTLACGSRLLALAAGERRKLWGSRFMFTTRFLHNDTFCRRQTLLILGNMQMRLMRDNDVECMVLLRDRPRLHTSYNPVTNTH